MKKIIYITFLILLLLCSNNIHGSELSVQISEEYKAGNISFIAEAGQRGEAGMTGFPVSEAAFREPPTYLMMGRLVKNVDHDSN